MREISTSDIAFGRFNGSSIYQPAKLTPAQRDEVGYRRMEGEGVRDLASEYGVSRSVIDKCAPKERPA